MEKNTHQFVVGNSILVEVTVTVGSGLESEGCGGLGGGGGGGEGGMEGGGSKSCKTTLPVTRSTLQ